MNANLTFSTSAEITIRRPPPGDVDRGAPYRISTGAVSWYATPEQAGAMIESLRAHGWTVESEPKMVVCPTFTTLRPPTQAVCVQEPAGPQVESRTVTRDGEIVRWSDGREEFVARPLDDEAGAEA